MRSATSACQRASAADMRALQLPAGWATAGSEATYSDALEATLAAARPEEALPRRTPMTSEPREASGGGHSPKRAHHQAHHIPRRAAGSDKKVS